MDQRQLEGKKFRIRRLEGEQARRYGGESDGLSPNDLVEVRMISPNARGLFAEVIKKNGKTTRHMIPVVFLDIKKCVHPDDIMVQPENQSIIDQAFVNPIKRVQTQDGHGWMVALEDDPKVQFVTKEVQIWQE